jgi:hypothetical protein
MHFMQQAAVHTALAIGWCTEQQDGHDSWASLTRPADCQAVCSLASCCIAKQCCVFKMPPCFQLLLLLLLPPLLLCPAAITLLLALSVWCIGVVLPINLQVKGGGVQVTHRHLNNHSNYAHHWQERLPHCRRQRSHEAMHG